MELDRAYSETRWWQYQLKPLLSGTTKGQGKEVDQHKLGDAQ